MFSKRFYIVDRRLQCFIKTSIKTPRCWPETRSVKYLSWGISTLIYIRVFQWAKSLRTKSFQNVPSYTSRPLEKSAFCTTVTLHNISHRIWISLNIQRIIPSGIYRSRLVVYGCRRIIIIRMLKSGIIIIAGILTFPVKTTISSVVCYLNLFIE